MRTQTVAMLLAIVAATAAPAGARTAWTSADAQPPATLTVTGYAQISRPPDLASVAVTIVTNDDSAARALSENNRRFGKLSLSVAAAGIATGDIISTSVASYFNPRPSTPTPNSGAQLFGYVVSRNVQLDVHALSTTGSVVDAAIAAGATQIDGVSYGFRDRGAVERLALSAAVNDASARAQAIAGAAHVQIVRILRIGNEAANPPARPQPLMAMAREKESVPTTIAPSDLDVTASVSITYLIR